MGKLLIACCALFALLCTVAERSAQYEENEAEPQTDPRGPMPPDPWVDPDGDDPDMGCAEQGELIPDEYMEDGRKKKKEITCRRFKASTKLCEGDRPTRNCKRLCNKKPARPDKGAIIK